MRKKQAWKNSVLNGIWTHDLCDTSAALLPTELHVSSQLGAGHLWFSYVPVDGEDMIWIYIVWLETHIFVLRKIHFKQMKIIVVMYSTLAVGLIAQLVRVLHWYCRGHGFESRSSLLAFSSTAKVEYVSAMIFICLKCIFAVQIYEKCCVIYSVFASKASLLQHLYCQSQYLQFMSLMLFKTCG